MKITLQSDIFLEALSHAKKIVDKKSSIPILKHLLLDARNEEVLITSTDMEHGLKEKVPAQVESEGTVAILAHILSDIIQKIPSGSEVTLTAEKDASRVLLTAGRAKFEVACLPHEDFPVVHNKDLPLTFEIHTQGLKNLLNHTSFAASTEETRYNLQGVYFHVDTSLSGEPNTAATSPEEDACETYLCAAATDGHRLACYRVPAPEGAESLPGFILSAKTCDVLSKLFDVNKETIRVSLSDSQVCFQFQKIDFTARLVDAEFPDYRAVIPKENFINIDVATDAFKQALERVSAVCDSKSSGVRLKIADNELLMTTIDKEYGSADDVLDIHYQGDPLHIGFNHAYLRDISQKIPNKATFQIGDTASATVMKDAEDQNALYVLMPMRL